MKPDKFLRCRFLFLALTVHKAQKLFTPCWGTNQKETFWLRNSCIVYERKTEDCARSRTYQHKSWHLCLLLRCLPGFITIPLYKVWFHYTSDSGLEFCQRLVLDFPASKILEGPVHIFQGTDVLHAPDSHRWCTVLLYFLYM